MTNAAITERLIQRLEPLRFGAPITHVYNPLVYARASWERYLETYGSAAPREVILVGMNPGPFGMAQTGVPFGEIEAVRDWLGLEAPVGKPTTEHPKRPVEGFACARSEVSGRRLWGWARDRFGTPDAFFARFFVWNYCPLVFMEDTGRNRTPDKLPVSEREPLYAACDEALAAIVTNLRPRYVLGVGAWAQKRAEAALRSDAGYAFGAIPHPSPASPLANRGWAEAAEKKLGELGVALP